ncbi:hypothetical protein NBO_27g0028 [Nosema bombycis CQ1]|uniref:Uncharacterized protein n=1 Tax=Nosema bombycis (strain CQ1 / CVCC 102059) TaxID=578461 RepID=R0KUG0_NOSB1|nr:hypothetical protein NBO_27g0028 [Nosema bombycis CQ1]|eukprot:EOB14471.1 hypothetical protein NBO_27g0028 [Nosema bombycis CQ1]
MLLIAVRLNLSITQFEYSFSICLYRVHGLNEKPHLSSFSRIANYPSQKS